jgi:hypothetical protein
MNRGIDVADDRVTIRRRTPSWAVAFWLIFATPTFVRHARRWASIGDRILVLVLAAGVMLAVLSHLAAWNNGTTIDRRGITTRVRRRAITVPWADVDLVRASMDTYAQTFLVLVQGGDWRCLPGTRGGRRPRQLRLVRALEPWARQHPGTFDLELFEDGPTLAPTTQMLERFVPDRALDVVSGVELPAVRERVSSAWIFIWAMTGLACLVAFLVVLGST